MAVSILFLKSNIILPSSESLGSIIYGITLSKPSCGLTKLSLSLYSFRKNMLSGFTISTSKISYPPFSKLPSLPSLIVLSCKTLPALVFKVSLLYASITKSNFLSGSFSFLSLFVTTKLFSSSL